MAGMAEEPASGRPEHHTGAYVIKRLAIAQPESRGGVGLSVAGPAGKECGSPMTLPHLSTSEG